MQPYQKAADVIRSRNERPGELIKQAGKIAGGAAAGYLGTKGLEKVIPAIRALTNPLVPDNIFEKGLPKVDDRFEKFIQGGLKEGYSYDDLRSFIEEKAQKSEKASQSSQNIIQQYSPELFQEISERIKKGESPIRVAANISQSPKYKKIIKQIYKDHNVDWIDLVESIFGNSDKSSLQAPEQTQITQQPNAQQSQSGGSVQDAIKATLQKIMKM